MLDWQTKKRLFCESRFLLPYAEWMLVWAILCFFCRT
jgi:hypothetical protein